jgi:hypothetical protein
MLLRMRNVSNKSSRKNQNTHFIFSNVFPKIVLFLEKMSKNEVEPERLQTRWCLRFACWINKTTRAQALAHATRPNTQKSARAHTHTHTYTNMKYLLLFHNNCFANASQSYFIRTLLVFFILTIVQGSPSNVPVLTLQNS